jgi:hypothetical protein
MRELVAEGSAHTILNGLGMTDEAQAHVSWAYIQNWTAGERRPESAIKQVFTAADAIIKAGRAPAAELAIDADPA